MHPVGQKQSAPLSQQECENFKHIPTVPSEWPISFRAFSSHWLVGSTMRRNGCVTLGAEAVLGQLDGDAEHLSWCA